MADEPANQSAKDNLDRHAASIGRTAGRLLRRGGPELQRKLTEARPHAERAARQALKYGQDHEDEIKRAALKGARMHVRGPFGFVFDALSNGLQQNAPPAPSRPTCPSCNAPIESAAARFCSQCGTRLTTG